MKTRDALVRIAVAGLVLVASLLGAGTHAASSIPNPPYGLVATPQKGPPQFVELSWIDNSTDEVGFKIERSLTSGTEYVELLTVPGDAGTYIDNGVYTDTTYYYRVRATNDAGDSEPSNEASVLTYPRQFWWIRATAVSATQIDLDWAEPNSTAETRVEQGLSESGPFSTVATLGARAVHYRVTGLTEGVRYYFRVVAFNATGDSEPSNVVSALAQAPTSLPASEDQEFLGCYASHGRSGKTGFVPGPVTLLVAILGFRILWRRRASRGTPDSRFAPVALVD